MTKSEFHQPTGIVIKNIELIKMNRYIIDEFETYWQQGSGDGYIDYCVNDTIKYSLLIGPNKKHGIYLHYIDNETDEHWLSLGNIFSLDEVAETADEIYASIGLFLPVEKAWEGVKEFLISGKRTDLIEWIKPDIIPADGNW